MLNEETIKKLEKSYCRAAEYLEEYFSANPGEREAFLQNFHVRPTSSYLGIVCNNDSSRFAMRTSKTINKAEFFDGIKRACKLIGELSLAESMSKAEILDKYRFNTYETGKRKEQTEYVIQAKFANYLKSMGYTLLATEFNIKSGRGGNRQRVDIVARKDDELWLVEIKDGDVETNASEQVNAYKNLVLQHKDTCIKLLGKLDKGLTADFNVKTAVVYTMGEKSKADIDKLWKYDGQKFNEEK